MFLKVELLGQRENMLNIFVDNAILPSGYQGSCFLWLSSF